MMNYNDKKFTDDEKVLSFLTIWSTKRLARFLNVPLKTLLMHTMHKYKGQYSTFSIPKKNGDPREIKAPCKSLKTIQEKLANLLYLIHNPSNVSHGFEKVKNRSIISNALVHQNKNVVLNIDLQNFFPSIHFGRIRGILKAKPYLFNENVAKAIANLCCDEDGAMPQGAPTSPILSNIICKGLDRELKRYARDNKCHYSRYADDITFSTKGPRIGLNHDDGGVFLDPRILSIIKNQGFEVNTKKSRLLGRKQPQIVTGLVTNKFVNVRRKYVRNIRATLYNIEKNQYSIEEDKFRSLVGDDNRSLKHHLLGKIEFIGNVRGRADHIYSKLILKLDNVVEDFVPQVLVERARRNLKTKMEIISESLWVIEAVFDSKKGKSSEVHVLQGTGFAMSGTNGIVTCRHNLYKDNGSEEHTEFIEVYRWDKPATKYKIDKVLFEDQRLDLAIVKIDYDIQAKLEYTREMPETLSEVSILGFPSHATGKGPLNVRTEVSQKIEPKPISMDTEIAQTSKRNLREFFVVNRPIITGTSGGPMLNAKGEVFGVVLNGGATNEEAMLESKNGGISIIGLVDHLESINKGQEEDIK